VSPHRGLLVALDFDGTLSPLVSDPAAARALPTARRAVERLAGSPSVQVALVSGRGLADLRAVASPPTGIHLICSPGAELQPAEGRVPGPDRQGADAGVDGEPGRSARQRRLYQEVPARYRVRDPEEVATVLHRLADRLAARVRS
jgi:trehalose-6-phosphatase